MKKLIIVFCLLLFASTLAFAGYSRTPGRQGVSGQISATQVAAVTVVDRTHVYILNQGTDEVYLNVHTDTAPTTSSAYLDSGEGIQIDSDTGIQNIRTICAAAETATVIYIAWD